MNFVEEKLWVDSGQRLWFMEKVIRNCKKMNEARSLTGCTVTWIQLQVCKILISGDNHIEILWNSVSSVWNINFMWEQLWTQKVPWCLLKVQRCDGKHGATLPKNIICTTPILNKQRLSIQEIKRLFFLFSKLMKNIELMWQDQCKS